MTSLVPEHVLDIGAHQQLAMFLKRFKENERRKACLKALLSAANFDFFKIELQQKNLIETLLEIVSNADEPGTLYMRELAFNIMSKMCLDCREN